MEFFNKKSVHIMDRDRVENIVSQLIKGGASKLQVISDFDHTISRVHKNGEKCSSTYGILDFSPFITEEYKNESDRLLKIYHPIEVDPTLTKDQKVHHMVEWYTKQRDLMPRSGITKSCLPIMVSTSNACLREGCDYVFDSLYKHDVPVLVFSAGIGDIVKEILQQSNLLYPNIKMIANFLCFDEADQLSGFKNDLIHTFNKNVSSLDNKDYFDHVRSRSNILLLGDSLGDLDMADGVPHKDAILKIGFLNFKIEENLPEYLSKYDVVLTDDQTMDVVIGLLNCILQGTHSK